MKKEIRGLKTFDAKSKFINVVIETPKGSRVKYAFSPRSGLFELKKILPKGLEFPFNFGFVPGTLGQDGDPLDILILNEEPLVPGCHVKVHLLGFIKAKQTEDGKTTRNDRLIGIGPGENDGGFQHELDEKILRQIEFFFVAYNLLEGKKFKIHGTGGVNAGRKIIHAGQHRHRQEKNV